jgi:rhomboid protease GluP
MPVFRRQDMKLRFRFWIVWLHLKAHIGIIHLLLNMYALIYIGILLEPYLGKARFLSAYLLTGICASTVSLWWHDLTVSAGASGAIFGMYGVFLAMLTTDLVPREVRKNLLASIAVFVGYNLLNGLKGGIDNAAHIGGLLSGAVIGYAFVPGLQRPEKPAFTTNIIALLSVLILSISFMVYAQLPSNFKLIDEKMKVFMTNESMALEVFHLSDTTATADLLYEIKDRGIYYWNENVKIIKELEKLSIPDQVHERNLVLLNYCELRLKSYQLLYDAVNTGDLHKNDEQVKVYNQQIDLLLKSLKTN